MLVKSSGERARNLCKSTKRYGREFFPNRGSCEEGREGKKEGERERKRVQPKLSFVNLKELFLAR